MRSPKYPRETLAQLRDRKVDDAARAHATSVRTREAAEREKQCADAQRTAHEASTAKVHAAERAALEGGDLRAGDLAQANSWGIVVSAERRQLESLASRAGAREQETREAERAAQLAVALREADAKVVGEDRARWQRERQKRIDAKEEEALSEASALKR